MSGGPGARMRLVLELLGYNLVLLALLPAIAGWIAWRALVLRKPIGRWSHRLGLVPRLARGSRTPRPTRSGPRIWLHAVSAGEMGAARPVLAELRRRFPQAAIALSTHTNTGMEMARRMGEGRESRVESREARVESRELPESRSSNLGPDTVFYLPFDCPTAIAIAMLRIRPDLLVVVEKELWPNLLGMARLFGARVLAVNGRVSDRMVRRARLAPWVVRRLYGLIDVMCVQSEEDAKRLAQLGCGRRVEIRESRSRRAVSPLASSPLRCWGWRPKVVRAGNTKADMVADRDAATEAVLKESLCISGATVLRPKSRDSRVEESEGGFASRLFASSLPASPPTADELWLVAGSTHPGETEQVVEAFLRARQSEPSARLLLAPRHLERVAEVSAMVAERGLRVVRRSEGRQAPCDAVVVLDTMGELRAAYALAAVAFVGGTLVPIGGHNLLEPPAVGVPVLFGPHTENCADMADLLLQAGIGFRVADSGELAAAFLRLARNPQLRLSIAQRARQLMAEQRGASVRCLAVAQELLARGVAG